MRRRRRGSRKENTNNNDNNKKRGRGFDLLFLYFLSVAGVFVGHPFDTTKIQLQIRTYGDHKIVNSSHAWNMVKAEGLVNSSSSTVVVVVVAVVAVVVVYTAGCIAGTVQLLLSCPVEVVKCTMQSQIPLKLPNGKSHLEGSLTSQAGTLSSKKYYRGPIHCCRDILATEGPKGFFKGLMTMFFRDVPTYGLYLLVYEGLFKLLVHQNLSDEKGVIASVLAGGVAGCVSWFVVMPLDVIKSRLQVDHNKRFRGFWDCAVTSVRNGGFSVLFRGTGLTMARAFPVNAMTFLVYSQVLNELNILNPPLRPKQAEKSGTFY
ncbi:solute carrier family 25 member 45 [Elysia marginata]|uniref:Solute carrier family 25 member 45 n=1 Tax=Elysia marginata TaxID=1093978 RepID=A0AAV4F8U0_9GAST|nr:solute carrier family 25 member 45 [Elysia marginata]